MIATNKTSKIEVFNITLGIINVVILIVSIVFANKAIKSNEDIATKSGSYDKGEIKITFGGYSVVSDNVYDVYYGFENISDSVLHFTNYPLAIHSEGKKTVEKLSLHFKYPHIMNMAIVEDSSIRLNNNLFDSERLFQTIEPYDHIMYKIHSLDPGISLGIGDIFVVRESSREMNVDATTADNYDISLLVNFEIASRTQVVLAGKDIDALQYDFNLNFQKVSSLEELILKVAPNIKKSILAKEKNRGYFFIVMPTIIEEIKTDLGVINMSHSKGDNTFLCVFDNTLKTISVVNQSGKEIKRMNLE